MESYTILPGRFQPPHNDHVELVRRLLTVLDGPLYLGLIVHAPGLEPPTTVSRLFTDEARHHHQPERTPFSFAHRLAMWRAIFDHELVGLPTPRVLALPRPELAWDWITAIFPGRRTWVVPQCGESFDDMKAAFFRRQGDELMRPSMQSRTDGWLVRRLLHDPRALADHVPTSVADYINALHQREQATQATVAKEIECR